MPISIFDWIDRPICRPLKQADLLDMGLKLHFWKKNLQSSVYWILACTYNLQRFLQASISLFALRVTQ